MRDVVIADAGRNIRSSIDIHRRLTTATGIPLVPYKNIIANPSLLPIFYGVLGTNLSLIRYLCKAQRPFFYIDNAYQIDGFAHRYRLHYSRVLPDLEPLLKHMEEVTDRINEFPKILIPPSSTFSILYDTPFWVELTKLKCENVVAVQRKKLDFGSFLLQNEVSVVERQRRSSLKRFLKSPWVNSVALQNFSTEPDCIKIVFSSLQIFLNQALSGRISGIDLAAFQSITGYKESAVRFYKAGDDFTGRVVNFLSGFQIDEKELFNSDFFQDAWNERSTSFLRTS